LLSLANKEKNPIKNARKIKIKPYKSILNFKLKKKNAPKFLSNKKLLSIEE
jgi:hypothetical protein